MIWWAGGWVGLTRAWGQSEPRLARALFGPIFWRSPPLHINASSPPPHQPIIPPPPPQPANLSREVAAILNLFPVAHLSRASPPPKDAMYAQIFDSSEASPCTYTHTEIQNKYMLSNQTIGIWAKLCSWPKHELLSYTMWNVLCRPPPHLLI